MAAETQTTTTTNPSRPPQITTHTLAHTRTPLHIASYTSLPPTTITHLRTNLLASNPTFTYAFIRSSLLLSPTHLYAACFRAIHAFETGRLRTRNVHSEILLCLSPNNNIKAALGVFGIGEAMEGGVVILKVGGTAGEMRGFLDREVVGEAGVWGVREVSGGTDWRAVGGIYRLGGVVPKVVLEGGGSRGEGEQQREGEEEEGEEQWRRDAEAVVLGMMALRGS